MRLVKPASGDVLLDGESVLPLHGDALSAFRRRVQFIFQDPYSSLNPRSRAGDIIREPMELLNVGPREERGGEVLRLMEAVGLRPDQARLFPHQFSGGQRQRIAIARALASRPELLCCDEPVSALDVAVQAQILNLLRRLQNDLGLSYLFISHDLGVIQYICDDIAVLYLGQIVETGTSESLFANPLHPYTRALLAAVPSADPRRRQEPEALPSGPAGKPGGPPRRAAASPRSARARWTSAVASRRRLWRPPPASASPATAIPKPEVHDERIQDSRPRLDRTPRAGHFRLASDHLAAGRTGLARIPVGGVVRGQAPQRRLYRRGRQRGYAHGLLRRLGKRQGRPHRGGLCRIRRHPRQLAGASALRMPPRRAQPLRRPGTPTPIPRSAWARSPGCWPPRTPCGVTASRAGSNSLASLRKRCAAQSPCTPPTGITTTWTPSSASTRAAACRCATPVYWDIHCGSSYGRVFTFECTHPETWGEAHGRMLMPLQQVVARAPGALDAVCLMYTTSRYTNTSMLPRSGGWYISEAILVGGQATADHLAPRLGQIYYCWRAPTLEMQDRIAEVLENNAKHVAAITHCEVRGDWVQKNRIGLPNHALARLAYRNMELAGPPQFGEEAQEFGRQILRNLGHTPPERPHHAGMQRTPRSA